jgi:hypothetical protein
MEHDPNFKRVPPPFEPVADLSHVSHKIEIQQLQNAELEATRRLCWLLIQMVGGEIMIDHRKFATMPKDAQLAYSHEPGGSYIIRALPKFEPKCPTPPL